MSMGKGRHRSAPWTITLAESQEPSLRLAHNGEPFFCYRTDGIIKK